MTTAEQWLPYPIDPRYEVSTHQRVRNALTGKVRALAENQYGHFLISVYKDGKFACHYVHRMIATTFIRMPEPGEQVNHKDGNPKNNHPSNLEWVTRSQNLKHAFRELKSPHDPRLTDEHVRQIRSLYDQGMPYRLIAKMYGISPQYAQGIGARRLRKDVK